MNKQTNLDPNVWEIKRKNILNRDGYIDQYIKRTTGRTVPANIVHHILPKEKYPQYAYADWNLISVSIDTHRRILHNMHSGELTKEGQKLMIETAFRNGIHLTETILVIGMPGTGKRAWVRDHEGTDAIVYSLDEIAKAMRLGREDHDGARRMANSLFRAFALRGKDFASRVYLIRTSISIEDISEILPDRVVMIEGEPSIKRLKEMPTFDPIYAARRQNDAIDFCKRNNIPVERIPPHH
jgi:hypothetical protein